MTVLRVIICLYEYAISLEDSDSNVYQRHSIPQVTDAESLIGISDAFTELSNAIYDLWRSLYVIGLHFLFISLIFFGIFFHISQCKLYIYIYIYIYLTLDILHLNS